MDKIHIWFYTDGSHKLFYEPYKADLSSWGIIGLIEPSTNNIVWQDQGVAPNDGPNQVWGEIMAAMKALEWSIKNGYQMVTIVTDLLGVTKWQDGSWKCNTSITKEYKRFMDKAHQKIRIRFIHIPGHGKCENPVHRNWNKMVDKLASSAFTQYLYDNR